MTACDHQFGEVTDFSISGTWISRAVCQRCLTIVWNIAEK